MHSRVKRVAAALLLVVGSGVVQAMPITGTFTVDGVEWAQPFLFSSLSWNEIDAVCPEDEDGVCAQSGELKGFDMEGWSWGGFSEVSKLFNHYLEQDGLIFPPDGSIRSVQKVDSLFAPAIIEDLKSTFTTAGYALTFGWMRNTDETDDTNAYAASARDLFVVGSIDRATIERVDPKSTSLTYLGAWVYRVDEEVILPAPMTVALVGVGLAGLSFTRRYNTDRS